ncbi:hypothetical protein AYI70_g2525 [Smittium culicis]|uniref:Uncharacterized protein n=1 Tax=Smittium culicis TaxID=133412 RepID=A0A1R1Y7T2_9FUNG|nr:hypothetical protein AYI70_g2525 [Smittium culicis]
MDTDWCAVCEKKTTGGLYCSLLCYKQKSSFDKHVSEKTQFIREPKYNSCTDLISLNSMSDKLQRQLPQNAPYHKHSISTDTSARSNFYLGTNPVSTPEICSEDDSDYQDTDNEDDSSYNTSSIKLLAPNTNKFPSLTPLPPQTPSKRRQRTDSLSSITQPEPKIKFPNLSSIKSSHSSSIFNLTDLYNINPRTTNTSEHIYSPPSSNLSNSFTSAQVVFIDAQFNSFRFKCIPFSSLKIRPLPLN